MKNLLMKYEALSAVQHQQVQQIELLDEQKACMGGIHGGLHALTARPRADIQGYVLLVADVPRGFFLLKRRSLLPPWAREQTATLHGLMIDRRHQGLGLGKACVQALPELIADLWPEIEHLMLAVDPGNAAALKLYHASGWTFSDDMPPLATNVERQMIRALR